MSTKVEVKYSELVRQAVIDSFKKLNPRDEIKNLVMFVVWVGSIWTTAILFIPGGCNLFNLQICLWLWFTCLFANFAEAMAEGRGKAHADALRKMRTKTMARKLVNGKEESVPSAEMKIGDSFVCEAGDMIPADGEIVEGIATVDESAITGESAPGHPRKRRRPQRRHRRHESHQRPDCCPRHRRTGQLVSRPDDFDDRRRAPPKDAERNRAEHRAGQPDGVVSSWSCSPCRRLRDTTKARPARRAWC